MSPFVATKKALRETCLHEGRSFKVDKLVYRRPDDCPGGWMSDGSLACIVFEEGDLPTEYNHPDHFGWWIRLGEVVSELCGQQVYFEHYNHFVVNLYPA